MSRLAGQGAFQKQMSSVDQALYETRAWLVKQFQKKQKTDAFKVIHVPAAAPVCSHREMGHFSREKERERRATIFDIMLKNLPWRQRTSWRSKCLSTTRLDSSRREKIKKSLFSPTQKININMSSSASYPLYYTFLSLSLWLPAFLDVYRWRQKMLGLSHLFSDYSPKMVEGGKKSRE